MSKTTVYVAACADAWGTACKVGAVSSSEGELLSTLPAGAELSVWPCTWPNANDMMAWFRARFTPRPNMGDGFFEGDVNVMKAAAREYVTPRCMEPDVAVRKFYENNVYGVQNVTLEDALIKFRAYASKMRWSVPSLDRKAFATIIAGWNDTSLIWRHNPPIPTVDDFIRRHIRPKDGGAFTLKEAKALFIAKGFNLEPISELRPSLESRLGIRCHAQKWVNNTSMSNVFVGLELVE